jgi:integrase
MIAAELDQLDAARVIVAAETGLRPEEWIALERRDIDRAGRALAVQRKYAKGVMRPYGKSHRARRRVPLTAKALAAIEQLPPRLDTALLFPASMGGHLEIRNWRTRNWYPALEAAGITRRGPYHLRHSFATEALAAGVSTFELSRVMGTPIGMIDRPLRAPRPRLRGLDQGQARRQIESFWRLSGVQQVTVGPSNGRDPA